MIDPVSQRLARPIALVVARESERRGRTRRALEVFGFRTVAAEEFSRAIYEMDFNEGITLVVAEDTLEETDRNGITGRDFIDCCRLKFPSRRARYVLVTDTERVERVSDDPSGLTILGSKSYLPKLRTLLGQTSRSRAKVSKEDLTCCAI